MQLWYFIQIDSILHGALTISLCTKDKAAAIILYSARENFGCRSAEPIDQNCQRASVSNTGVLVFVLFYRIIGIAHLPYRTGFNEQAGKFDSFHQRATAVLAHIHYNTFNTLLFQRVDQYFNI